MLPSGVPLTKTIASSNTSSSAKKENTTEHLRDLKDLVARQLDSGAHQYIYKYEYKYIYKYKYKFKYKCKCKYKHKYTQK